MPRQHGLDRFPRDAEAVPAEIRTDLVNGPIARYRAVMAMRDLIVVIRFHLAQSGS